METFQQTPSAPTSEGKPSGRSSGPRAGFWRRFAAAFLDGLILIIIAVILRLALGAIGSALLILVSAAYYTYFEGTQRGQTPGKSALSIRVISFETGGSIGHGRAFIRWIGRYVSTIVIFLGYLWMLWDREKQTWHDKFAGSVVVPESAYPPQ